MNALENMMGKVQTRLETEPVLRAAVWIVVALVLLNFIFVVGDWRRESVPQIQQMHDQYRRLEQVLNEADWRARSEAARAHLEAMQDRFWSAESEGLARAEFQVWLERTANRTNFDILQIELRPLVAVDDLPGWYRLGATLTGSSDPAALVRFLGVLADGDRLVIVDGLNFGGGNARSRIDLHAVVRFEAESGQ